MPDMLRLFKVTGPKLRGHAISEFVARRCGDIASDLNVVSPRVRDERWQESWRITWRMTPRYRASP